MSVVYKAGSSQVSITVRALFLSTATSQHHAVPVCSHSGCHVVLHGRQEVQDGFFGGSSVTRSQTHSGGAEHPAGRERTHPNAVTHVLCSVR